MWSLGLIAAELVTGYPLYPGETEYDMLRFIMQTQGQPEDYILDRERGTVWNFHRQCDNIVLLMLCNFLFQF